MSETYPQPWRFTWEIAWHGSNGGVAESFGGCHEGENSADVFQTVQRAILAGQEYGRTRIMDIQLATVHDIDCICGHSSTVHEIGTFHQRLPCASCACSDFRIAAPEVTWVSKPDGHGVADRAERIRLPSPILWEYDLRDLPGGHGDANVTRTGEGK